MLKLSENPPIKPDDIESLAALEGDWWVAHTKARSEKALAWDLVKEDIPYFLPMMRRIAYWGGRKRQILTPIFPSYVFFCGDLADKQRVMSTDRVCQSIPVRQREQFVSELLAIDLALHCDMQLMLYPFATIGRRCRVRQGPLMGTEGTIVRIDNATRFVLQVSMLGQGVALEISPDLLEPID